MATNLSTTKLSRRAALAGGASAIALAGTATVAVAAMPVEWHEPLLEIERQNTTAHALASDLCKQIDRKELAYHREGIATPDLNVQWRNPGSLHLYCMAFDVAGIRRQAIPEWVDRLTAELDGKRAERDRLGLGALDAAVVRARSEWNGIEARIAATPAKTPEGIAVKLRLLIEVADLYGETLETELATSMLADLGRLADTL